MKSERSGAVKMLLSRTVKNVLNTFFCGFAFAICVSESAIIGSEIWPTKGEVWPKPQMRLKYDKYYIVEPEKFQFDAPIQTCSILEEALQRYWRIMATEFEPMQQDVHASARAGRSHKAHSKRPRPKPRRRGPNNSRKQDHHHDQAESPWTLEPRSRQYAQLSPQVLVPFKSQSRRGLSQLRVQLSRPCEELPYLEMDESYDLSIGPTEEGEPAAVLDSRSVWGALRGLETFSQLLYRPSLDSDVVQINVTFIRDFARFRHRGLLLDTSRHYLPTYRILQVLDAMSYNKLNVFHWHIVDDHSFPYQSLRFPKLSERGAFHPQMMIYTMQDIKMVVEHARARGIRVLPEFDVPGHTRSWGEAFPKLLVRCYKRGNVKGTWGPMDPTAEYTFKFLKEFFEEVMAIFPDDYLHFGGDEVDLKCWESNPSIQRFMRRHNLTRGRQLQAAFTARVLAGARRRRAVVWAEAAEQARLPRDAIVQIWKDAGSGQITEITEGGHHVIFSSCWYLAQSTWRKMYECDPRGLVPRAALEPFVVGGEACMWGETVDGSNVLTSVFPRTCAVAERLWSSLDTVDVTEASHRLEEQTCRMNRRGIDAQPANGPGFCL